MDPELATLARSAGLTVVTRMAADAWRRTREGIVSFWQRACPERAEVVPAELAATREGLAHGADTEAELTAEWQGRVRRPLIGRPECAKKLRGPLDALGPIGSSVPGISQRAIACGAARVHQAGRDQHINERPTNR